MLDSSQKISNEDKELIEKLNEKNYIILLNKSDLKNNIDLENIPDFIEKNNIMNISTLEKKGIEELKNKIYSMAVDFEEDGVNSIMVTNSRHYSLLEKAISSLKDAKHSLLDDVELDILETDYIDAMHYLGEITGDSVSESLLDTIFSKFCIGK